MYISHNFANVKLYCSKTKGQKTMSSHSYIIQCNDSYFCTCIPNYHYHFHYLSDYVNPTSISVELELKKQVIYDQ